MSFDIKIKNKEQKIKFNYALNFKANKKLASKDKDGNSQNDGAGILFVQVLEKEDDALVNLLQLVDKNFTEKDVLEAVQSYTDNLVNDGKSEEEAYNQIFTDLKVEMLDSGFFVSKIRKYKENLDKAQQVLASRKTEDSKLQADELKKLAERITKEIS
ncbi:hypothetical protein M4I17_04590 [Enterococcus thailandicus]|uniref:hypothetical protein n=1 Tax=Enterococcus thailandicus TaxID=417368 RepID=UPI002542DF67|nr:hypothetical protein [Enterococcus thailandicus]MDK4351686.1 hypothetical protein [Enterococcus thailandicus]